MIRFTFYFWLQRFDDWHDLEVEIEAEDISKAIEKHFNKYPISKITRIDFKYL